MTERVIVVTGAVGPMGSKYTEKFIEIGHTVIALDINEKGLSDLSDKYSGNCFTYTVDLTDSEDLQRVTNEIIAEHGFPDVLVNNAGLLTKNKLQSTSVDEWEKIMSVNLTAPFLLCKYLIPGMIEKGWGRVINITSLAAKTGGITAGTTYSTSKGGLSSLTFSLAAETAGTGVTVNGIAPAYVKTPMVTEQLTEEERQKLLKNIPVKRFCEPDEVAALVIFLAGDDSGFITGEIIDQNGGLLFD